MKYINAFLQENLPELLLIVGFIVSSVGVYFEFGRNITLMFDGVLLVAFSLYLTRGN